MRLLRLVEAGRIPYRTARAGVVVDLGGGVALTVVYPPEPIPLVGGDPVHAGAVISRLTYGATAMLLTGDAEGPAEHYLLERGATLASQVLKVGHHGSRGATSERWLAELAPSEAVISVGAKNRYGHPAPEVLARLRAHGITVLRTDERGTITFTVSSQGTRAYTDVRHHD
jgi:competence protein ComEC